MIADLAWLLVKLVVGAVLVIVVRAIMMHMKNQKILARLMKEGIHNYPGNDGFLFGPSMSIEEEYQKRCKSGIVNSNRLLF